LKVVTEDILSRHVDESNAIEIFKLGEKYESKLLMECSFKSIQQMYPNSQLPNSLMGHPDDLTEIVEAADQLEKATVESLQKAEEANKAQMELKMKAEEAKKAQMQLKMKKEDYESKVKKFKKGYERWIREFRTAESWEVCYRHHSLAGLQKLRHFFTAIAH
jgi:hypothetical protein